MWSGMEKVEGQSGEMGNGEWFCALCSATQLNDALKKEKVHQRHKGLSFCPSVCLSLTLYRAAVACTKLYPYTRAEKGTVRVVSSATQLLLGLGTAHTTGRLLRAI